MYEFIEKCIKVFVFFGLTFSVLLVIFLLMQFVLGSIEFFSSNGNTVPVVSQKDHLEYKVQKGFGDANTAANILSVIHKNNETLIRHLEKKYPRDRRIAFLKSNYNRENIEEADLNNDSTSYTMDKGREYVLCLRDKKDEEKKIHDLNTLMFVNLHELSHLMTDTYGHNAEFWSNFAFILKEAKDIGIYEPKNYASSAKDYCGIKITSNPYYS